MTLAPRLVAPAPPRPLAAQEPELRDFLENALEGVHKLDADGRIAWANRSAHEMLGYTPDEYLGHQIGEFHVDPAEADLLLRRLTAGEAVREMSAQLRCRDGSIRCVLISANARRKDGAFLYARCFTRDGTRQWGAEELVRERNATRAHLAAIVESSDDAIVSKTLDGQVTSWNAGAERLFGYSAEEMIGRSITTIIPAELGYEEQIILRELRAGRRIDHYETQRVTKDGRRVEVSLTVSPVFDADGAVIGVSKIARDIGDRKRYERGLIEADRRKSEFLAILAHELRNPLAPIRYALAVARQPGSSAAHHQRAEEIIERQVYHMSRLLDDLLDVSRITRGVLELRKTQVELTAAVADALEAARPLLDAKHHLFTLQLPPDPIRLHADPVRLAQIFANLLINAAKYTDTGGRISLTARREVDSVCVRVRDNGIGIEPATLPRLFELFSQGTAALERSEGGLGVGLALVRGLLMLHGGSIEVHSEGAGCGSEFTVRLPLGPESGDSGAVGPPSERAGHGSSLRVLVADDNRDAAETCAMLLQLSGHEVQVVHSGRAALEAAERFRPHVALLDIGMPELSGYDIASRIRAAPWGEQVALIAVTGWGQEEDRRRALSSGFDRHLVKPIDPVLLEQLLREIAAGGSLKG